MKNELYRARFDVLFGDVDPAGIVYYPRLIHYLHVAMENFFKEVVGRHYASVLEDERIGQPAVRLETEFLRPLRYGDRVAAEVEIDRLGRSSIQWVYRLMTDESSDPHAVARITTVNIGLDSFRPQELPAWLRESLEKYRQGQWQ